MKKLLTLTLFLLGVLFMTSCRTPPPIQTEDSVDLERFMGDWWVHANVPTFIEKGVWNALEQYELNEDGTVATTFSFNKGAADGPRKTYYPKGFVRDTESNAVWDMQFIWPIKAEYRILYVDEDYTETVIGRRKRDYLWIMFRDQEVAEERLQALIDFAVEQGYEREAILRVPLVVGFDPDAEDGSE